MSSQNLLSLVARLQQVMPIAHGRAMLLNYARKSCGARLALLFTLDQQRQQLKLLEYCGRHPHPSSFTLETAPVELSLQGLFASALQYKSFIDIPDISLDYLALPEELFWTWPRGRVLIHGLRQGLQRGVLVFCFTLSGDHHTSPDYREELLICDSLLSAYLGQEDNNLSYEPIPAEAPMKIDSPVVQSQMFTGEQTSGTLAEHEEFLSTEDLAQLMILHEQALLLNTKLDRSTNYDHLLQQMTTALHASAGALWIYRPVQQELSLEAYNGELDKFTTAASAELTLLMETSQCTILSETMYGLLTLPQIEERTLIWHTLRWREQFLGVCGLVLSQPPVLQPGQLSLLHSACDILALTLLHYDIRLSVQEEIIEQERNRIAHDLHDSVVQNVAHAAQKLDYVQHILSRQPQEAINELERTRNLLKNSLRDLRYSISSLLPVSLTGLTFEETLVELLREFKLNSPQIEITCNVEPSLHWPQELSTTIYRFIQEALNNVRKHSSASDVSLSIHQTGSLGIIQVTDNGCGFVPEQMRNQSSTQTSAAVRLGLLTMEERIRQVGGTLEIASQPGKGVALKALVPISLGFAILTTREREVLRLLVDGLTNRAISERLSVSVETVKSHIHHIMQKMHVKDRTQAAVMATKHQWL